MRALTAVLLAAGAWPAAPLLAVTVAEPPATYFLVLHGEPSSSVYLGLNGAQPADAVRVSAYGPGYTPVDQSDWITFDAAQPVIDTTLNGLSGTPFFDDGSLVSGRFNPAAAAANGLSPGAPAQLLLLHHMNPLGSQVDVVNAYFGLVMLPPALEATGGKLLRWTSSPYQLYTIEYSTNLLTGFPLKAAVNLPATPPVNSFVVTNAPAGGALFYRIRQQ